jgi:hypothetical protein
LTAKLRHRRFFTLAELNHAIAGLVDELNRKPSRHLSGVSCEHCLSTSLTAGNLLTARS